MTIVVVKCIRCGKWRGTVSWGKTSTCAFCGKKARHEDPRVIKYHPEPHEKQMEVVARFNKEGR